jgi:hypothetical protein
MLLGVRKNNERIMKEVFTMRRLILKCCCVFVCAFLTACTNTVADKNNTETSTIGDKIVSNIVNDTSSTLIKPSLTIKDYYPFNENNVYYYEGEGNEYASYGESCSNTIQ